MVARATAGQPPPDYVDRLIADWQAERPDLNVQPVAIVYRLLRLAARLAPEVEKAFDFSGITSADFAVLANLRRAGRPYQISQRELMDRLALTSGTVSVRINRLEALGLVQRDPDPHDGRGVLATLTDDGERLFDSLAPRHLANEARLIAALDPTQQAALARLLQILLVEYEPPLENRPWESLGLTLAPAHVTRERRDAVGLPPASGLLVDAVRPDGPGAVAGVQPGDLLVHTRDRELCSFTALAEAIAGTGHELEVEVQRADHTMQLRIAIPPPTRDR